jgi:hypothetical protein
MNNISIAEEDDLSDEYDFMDEDPEARAREKAKQQGPVYKYKEIMQLVADRKQDEIVVDLNDLQTVGFASVYCHMDLTDSPWIRSMRTIQRGRSSSCSRSRPTPSTMLRLSREQWTSYSRSLTRTSRMFAISANE